jgi:hypothetical protein
MTKIAISPNPSGTGTFTLTAPDSNTNRTITLPDAAGVVLTDTSDIEAQVKTATNATGSAPIYACRAWGNFNGDTIAARFAQGISIARDATGDFTFTLSPAMPDANYAVLVSCNTITAVAVIAVSIASSSAFTVNFRREDTGVAGNPMQIFIGVIR